MIDFTFLKQLQLLICGKKVMKLMVQSKIQKGFLAERWVELSFFYGFCYLYIQCLRFCTLLLC